jgi:phage tail-like protein
MEFTRKTTATLAAWEAWHRTNVAHTEEGVEIAPASQPSYVSPEPLPVEFEPVDLALDECGDLYLLAPDGAVHRYDPVRGTVDSLECAWRAEEAGAATAIAVTRRSLYVAGANGHLQAYARRLHQTRWILREFDSPVALDATGDAVQVLDEGDGSEGAGILATVGPRSAVERVVTGLTRPRDVATSGDATTVLAGTAETGGRRLRQYDEAFAETAAVDVPGAVDATCVETETDGDPLVGVGDDTGGETGLFRYAAGEFERLDGPAGTTSALALSTAGARGRPRGLYAVREGETQFLEAVRKRQVNPATGRYDAQLVRRIDSGEPGTEWHRVTTEFDLAETGTQIQVRYVATDDSDLQYGEDAVALEAVDGIGETYADRLRGAGVRGLGELVEQSPGAVASAASGDILDVQPDQVAGWMEAGRARLAESGGPLDPEIIDGIGETYARRLRDAGIEDVATLVERSPAAIARIVSARVSRVSADEAAGWIERARQLLADRDDIRGVEWTTVDPPNPADALLEGAEGRYLWVQLDLVGDQFVTPRVGAFRVYFPRRSYLRYLPAAYGSNPESAAFLERFLSIFESAFTDIEAEIGAMTRYIDPGGAPAPALEWLGGWLGVEAGETWPEPARRELIDRAPALFKKRGTREGLLELLRLYLRNTADYRVRRGDLPPDAEGPTGDGAGDHAPGAGTGGPRTAEASADPTATGGSLTTGGGAGAAASATGGDDGPQAVYLLEHSDLDCIDDPAVRTLYERLVPCPQCFLVLVRSWFGADAARTAERIVDREQPAHAVGRTVQLRPWIQLGGNSYLGINTRLPDREFTVEEASLGNDSVLGSRESDGQVGLRRIGTDTTLS